MLQNLLKNKDVSPILIAFAAGLYPFLHYYNSNFDLADSWVQLLFLLGICFVLPVFFVVVSKYVFRLSFLKPLEKYRLSVINIIVFSGLISILVFLSNKKTFVLVVFLAGLLGLLVYKHLGKIVILQLLLAVMSFVSFIPRVIFMVNYNDDWTLVEDNILDTRFKKTPNIYVIQPDGYTNFAELREEPYNYNDTRFEEWLTRNDFVNYTNFRSNYYSTLTSNSSMFAMKHHYYSNTFRGNLKTYGSQEIIVGDNNNVLKILKNNAYTSHLITDNSFFLVNRKLSGFDYCNIDQSKVKLYDSGGVRGADIVSDFETLLKNTSTRNNFYFIEKTIPSHVTYAKSYSTGVEGERELYLERLEVANDWLKELINIINTYDDNAMIVIIADHGGYVGLSYMLEVERKQLSELEAISVFSSLLSIKWPDGDVPEDLSFRSNVNLFRTIFSYLSDDPSLLNYKEEDKSFIPLYDGSRADFFECINEDYEVQYRKLDP